MNGARIVAEKYAGALFAAAEASGKKETVTADLGIIKAALSSEKIRRFFRDPSVCPDTKKKAALSLSEAGLSPLGCAFFGVLLEERRVELLDQIIAVSKEIAADAAGEALIEAVYAKTPDASTLKRLGALAEKKFARKPNITCTVDPSLIGGFLYRAGSKQYDYSIRTALRRIADHCKNEAA